MAHTYPPSVLSESSSLSHYSTAEDGESSVGWSDQLSTTFSHSTYSSQTTEWSPDNSIVNGGSVSLDELYSRFRQLLQPPPTTPSSQPTGVTPTEERSPPSSLFTLDYLPSMDSDEIISFNAISPRQPLPKRTHTASTRYSTHAPSSALSSELPQSHEPRTESPFSSGLHSYTSPATPSDYSLSESSAGFLPSLENDIYSSPRHYSHTKSDTEDLVAFLRSQSQVGIQDYDFHAVDYDVEEFELRKKISRLLEDLANESDEITNHTSTLLESNFMLPLPSLKNPRLGTLSPTTMSRPLTPSTRPKNKLVEALKKRRNMR
ncbi:hypothetical protein IWQ62_003475 [Dispira parvispora]|uniref:Uncharacterized protein n=1 Tax=Dispira parvispora TaxID=1520584 RepID=A0A9W8E695_9FUNG|nr:hypothetical protein IWQ62_003475 [Dispira parvispora]